MKEFLIWIRRDIRLFDHTALSYAINDAKEQGIKGHGHLVFVLDQVILNKLQDKKDQRLSFILEGLMEIQNDLKKINCNFHLLIGDPKKEIPLLCKRLKITDLYFNRDYDPYAISRDLQIKKLLTIKNITIHDYKDHVIFEKHEVLTQKLKYYQVFTPYKNQWIKNYINDSQNFKILKTTSRDLEYFLKKDTQTHHMKNILNSIGFIYNAPFISGGRANGLRLLEKFKKKIHDYKDNRDFINSNGTSMLSPFIRHGMISIREMLELAVQNNSLGSQAWQNEIIWRDFYQMILSAFPYVTERPFKLQYQKLIWPGVKDDFYKWCNGVTGVPIVDAAQRCLNATGTMPNRLRMISASYLCKILLIDWRLGEKYFAKKLLDYDLAANNGGWQWSASTGCDAQPYFRIFNPYQQSLRYDHEGLFIKKFCPELSGFDSKSIHRPDISPLIVQLNAQCVIGEQYPLPIQNYEAQRQIAISLFKNFRT